MGANCDEFLEENIQVAKLERGKPEEASLTTLRHEEWYFPRRSWEKSISVHRNSMDNRPKEKKGLVSMRE